MMKELLKVLLRKNKKRLPTAIVSDVKLGKYILSCFTEKK